MIGIIYKLEFRGCKKVYVGQTFQPLQARLSQHLYGMKSGRHHCCGVQQAYDSFGHPGCSVLDEKSFEIFVEDLAWDPLTLMLADSDELDEYGDAYWDNPAFLDDHATLVERMEEAGSIKKWLDERESFWINHYSPNLLNSLLPHKVIQ